MRKKKMTFAEGIRAQFSTKSLVLIPIAVGINLIGGTLCSALKLPLFLDMIGTIVVACLSGIWVSALCGLLTNVFLALVANPVYLPYSIVSVLCAAVTGYMVKKGFFKNVWGAVLTWLACTLTNTISVLSTSMLENLIDKGITFFIAFILIQKIPKRFLSQYAADTDDEEDDED